MCSVFFLIAQHSVQCLLDGMDIQTYMFTVFYICSSYLMFFKLLTEGFCLLIYLALTLPSIRSMRNSCTGPYTETEWTQCVWTLQSCWRKFWGMMTSSLTEETCPCGKIIGTWEDTAMGLSQSKTVIDCIMCIAMLILIFLPSQSHS